MTRAWAALGCVVAGTALGVTATAYDGQWLLGVAFLALGAALVFSQRVRRP